MASANISFSQIPSSIRVPGKYFEFNAALAVRTLPGNLQKVCVVAQKTASGTATADEPVAVYDSAQAGTLFGRGSVAALMCTAALRANPYLQLYCCPVVDATGTPATGTVTITGPATSAGEIVLWVGNQSIATRIADDDTANTIAAAIVANITAHPDLPVSGAVGTNPNENRITLTAKNDGTLHNGLPVSYTTTASGVSAAIVAMANGATDADYDDALAAIFTAGYHLIAWPWAAETALDDLKDWLDETGGAIEQRGALGVVGWTDTAANAIVRAATQNSERITLACAPGSISMPWEIAAAYAAVIAYEEDPARPLNTLELNGIAEIPTASLLSNTAQETCLNGGVTPLTMGPGGRVQIVRAITTYTVDPQSVPDPAWLDLTTIRTLDYVRVAIRQRIALRFPRSKLSTRVEQAVRSEIIDVLFAMEQLEILENVEDNLTGLIVERDLQDPNRLNARIPADVVNGLHVFAGRIDLIL